MPEEDEVSLYDYIKVISKRKWLIVIGTFVCILTAAIVTFFLPRVYETGATLTMEGVDIPDVKIGVLNIPTLPSAYETRAILSVEEPVTPDMEIGVLTIFTGLSIDKFFSYLPDNRDLNLEVIRNLGLDKSPDELTPQALSQIITFGLAKDSRIITINVRYSHPQKARDIANTMAEVVKEHYQVLNEAEIIRSRNLIDEQLNLVQARLVEAEQNFQTFKETVDVDSLKKEMGIRSLQDISLAQEYLKVNMSLIEQEARLTKAEEELQKQDRFYVLSKSIAEDSIYKGILDELLEDDIALLQKVKSESQQINPIYVDLEKTVTNARISIAGAKAKEPFLKQKIEENRLVVSRAQVLLAEKEPEWETLTEGYNRAEEEYQSIQNTHNGAVRLLAAAKTRQLKTVGTAGVPSKPIEPNTKQILLIAAVVGLLAALFLAFFLEYLARMRRLEAESKKQEN